jgi:hypothetical protein
MKRVVLLFISLVFGFYSVFAKPVDPNIAQKVGSSFLTRQISGLSLKSYSELELVYSATSNSGNTKSNEEVRTYFYVFNVGQQGFIIVSGDDDVVPILGYSDEGAFDPEAIVPGVRKWLESYKNQIRYVVENSVPATKEIEKQWSEFLSESNQVLSKSVETVSPLAQAKWDQAPYVNDLCPFDASANERTVSGCVATAMAIIMKYWNYPSNGTGFHSYNHPTYGTLSANFGSTSYDWSSMPNVVNSPNNAVALLMYHLGVSVNMSYGVSSTGGSSAYVINAQSPIQNCSEYALKNYFGYKSSMQGVQRVHYTPQQWMDLLKAELNASRPILYAGFGSGGGHAFVCDGYDSNNFFHFNWGWGGAYDGYFMLGALNPGGVGIGGGTGGFNDGHQALIGIEPPATTGTDEFDLNLYDFVETSSSTINYGQSFQVTTNIANFGTATFSGDFGAAIFDSEFNFIDFVDVLSDYTLEGGFTYNNKLVFENSGLFSMLPGNYYIGVFYRPTDGNWSIVSDNGDYINVAQMEVIHINDIELNSDIVITPGKVLIQGEPASVNLNILNDGFNTFLGQYQVNLYELDGSFVQTINTLTESNGLPSGFTYLNPFLTFSSSSIEAPPGSYLLAVIHKPNNNTNWQLTGSSYFQNPVKITVQLPALAPDPYEPNDLVTQSYHIPLEFSGETIRIITTSANLHQGNDNDFYAIDLPLGFDYIIDARLHDSYNSGDGNVYTVDALFSVSADGTNWTETFDDVMPGYLIYEGGGPLFFHVAPYFAGEMGTYVLDVKISKEAQVTSDESIEFVDELRIYPNPANDFVMVDWGNSSKRTHRIEMYNMQGQILETFAMSGHETNHRLALSTFTDGIYLLRIYSDEEILTHRIVISR